MTTLEKKNKIIQKIQEMPDELLDDILEILDNIPNKQDGEFEKYLMETSKKYKKVWEALA